MKTFKEIMIALLDDINPDTCHTYAEDICESMVTKGKSSAAKLVCDTVSNTQKMIARVKNVCEEGEKHMSIEKIKELRGTNNYEN